MSSNRSSNKKSDYYYYYYYYYYCCCCCCCCCFLETVGLRVPDSNFRDAVCLMLAVNVETALPLDALRRQMPSTVILIYSVDVWSRLTIG